MADKDGFYRNLIDNLGEGVYFVEPGAPHHILEQGG